MILERIKEPLKALIDEEQAGPRSGFSCTDHINTLQVVMEHCVEIRCQPYLLNMDFKRHDGTKCHILHQ